MNPRSSIEFFEEQFQRQVAARDYALNPFERAALPHLSGRVLDYGCGLGNLALHAARAGCRVTAIDASHTAIEHLQAVARSESLPLHAVEAELSDYRLAEDFDTVVCIGLLMFFDCPTAYRQLGELQAHVRPGGIVIVNVLVEGTTFMDMFAPGKYCLFERGELQERFRDWQIVSQLFQDFDAPGNKRKAFCTIIARKPQVVRGAA